MERFLQDIGGKLKKIRVAVAGAGAFGKNHLRVLSENPRAEIAGVLDPDPAAAQQAAAAYGCPVLPSPQAAAGRADAAIVAAPTIHHASLGCQFLEAGLDVLVEKPIADTSAAGRTLVETAARTGRLLQVGHLERFNPAVQAIERIVNKPLFFEIHRLSEFSLRSLDVDVVLDLMIHDIEIVLALTGKMPEEVRAAGISILSGKVDLANVRLAFPGGCVANLTASRVSTERVRKLRLFQPHQYITVDYAKREAASISVGGGKFGLSQLPVENAEPLRLEVDSFLDSVEYRTRPRVNGEDGLRALEVAESILDRIKAHAEIVAESLRA
ncbi:MAG: Gfo/Idh/MocA family oxidoreductase [Bryobacteraceae bacterium]